MKVRGDFDESKNKKRNNAVGSVVGLVAGTSPLNSMDVKKTCGSDE